jgi:putative PIN family toxin of toxin-antitoxin system
MRRVVLDTNVLVASLLQPVGRCGRLLDLVVDGAAEVCVDDRVLAEYAEVLTRRKLHLPPEKVQTLLEFFRQSGIPVIAHPLAVTTLPDPDDLAFLEVAASGEALLVTGNQRHFPKSAPGAVSVLSPAECLEALRKHA